MRSHIYYLSNVATIVFQIDTHPQKVTTTSTKCNMRIYEKWKDKNRH